MKPIKHHVFMFKSNFYTDFVVRFYNRFKYQMCLIELTRVIGPGSTPATTPLRPRRSEDLTMRNSTLQRLLACMVYISKLLTCLLRFSDVTRYCLRI